jgi:hypothetical protein
LTVVGKKIRSVVRLFGYLCLASDEPPEKKAVLRAAAAVIIAFTVGVFVIFLCF